MRAKTPAIAAAAAIIATSFAACEDTIAYAAPCPPVMHFAVGGVGDPNARAVPTPQPRTVIHYSASLAPIGNIGGDTSVREGERNLDHAARAFRQRCPDSRIEATGASMGALIAGNVRDRWQHDPTMRRNTRFVLISDPRARNGAMNQLPSFIPGFTHTGTRPASTIPTSTVCRDNDFICNAGNPFQNPGHAVNAAIGYLTGAHAYSTRDVDRSAGHHALPPTQRHVPDTPLPVRMPTPREVLEPIVQAIVPDAPITPQYTPTPIREYVPPAVKPFVPKHLGDTILPPLPPIRLPRL